MHQSLRSTLHTRVTGPTLHRRGLTLIEVLIAVSVFAIAIGAVSTSLVNTSSLRSANRETTIASDAAESMLENVAAQDFEDVFVLFNRNPKDDPDGEGTAPGCYFDVDLIDARRDDPDGFVGEILFPGDGLELREDANDPALGLPRDLNGDSVIDGLDHSADYILLPVRVRLEWRGLTGNGSMEFLTTLARL